MSENQICKKCGITFRVESNFETDNCVVCKKEELKKMEKATRISFFKKLTSAINEWYEIKENDIEPKIALISKRLCDEMLACCPIDFNSNEHVSTGIKSIKIVIVDWVDDIVLLPDLEKLTSDINKKYPEMD